MPKALRCSVIVQQFSARDCRSEQSIRTDYEIMPLCVVVITDTIPYSSLHK